MLAMLLGTAFLLSAAEVFMHVQALEPCLLCVSQQLAFFAIGLLAAAALSFKSRHIYLPAATGLVSIGGGALAIRQLWLQSLPPDKVPACGASFDYLVDVLPIGELIAAMLSGTGECAETDWTMFGLTMAGWALLAFAAFLVISVYMIVMARR